MTASSPTSAHRARRRFGQHFLKDRDVVDEVITTIAPCPGQTFVEIGPGLGALTEPLLDAGVNLQVIEIDRDLVTMMKRRAEEHDRLTVHSADALVFDLRSIKPVDDDLRVVGNLPYNISTPLIFHLLRFCDSITDMHFMLQNEVVDRLVADAGDRAYGRLSVMTQLYCVPEKMFEVGPRAFSPPPKVDSAVIRMTPREQPAAEVYDLQVFEALVKTAFSMRRKTLRNSLRRLVDQPQWERAGIDPSRRAETLHVVEFAALSNEVSGI